MGEITSEFEERVIIVGVGLIGGSIAATIRQRFPNCHVQGIGRCADRLQAAAELGLLNSWSTELTPQLLTDPSVVVICLPVHLIASQVCRIAEMASDQVLITDAGSVKAVICDAVNAHPQAARLFVGAHPIAGGEQGGFEYAVPDLFDDKVCVVTKGHRAESDPSQSLRARRFWQQLGCRIVDMTAAEHDRVLALTSHLPHLMAAVTTAVAGTDNLPLTGSGFRDSTRIAAGDAVLWTAIMTGNRQPLINAICCAERQLAKYRTALEQDDDSGLHGLLAAARECRRELDVPLEDSGPIHENLKQNNN